MAAEIVAELEPMKTWGLAAGLGVALFVAPPLAHAQKLVYVVRHAERADGGAAVPAASMSAAPADPSLSAAGAARAVKLASLLGAAGITAVYATEFKRTQETARPLAAEIKVPITTVAARDTAALVAALKSTHASGIVLVVAHSNTMPAIVTALGGPSIAVGDSDYGDVYVIVPGTGTLSRLKF
jgi:broad specificity phosphatase PhoE